MHITMNSLQHGHSFTQPTTGSLWLVFPCVVQVFRPLVSFLILLGPILLLSGCGEQQETPSEALSTAADDSPLEHAVKHLDPTYICPMHPQIVKGEPGNCPICGMHLMEQKSEQHSVLQPAADLDPGSSSRPPVSLTSAIVQTLGVRSARVERGTLQKSIDTVGRIEYDEARLAHVHPRADGWIETLRLRAEGEPARRGQSLAELYAPDILSAQVDFLLSRQGGHPGQRRINADNARNILRLLDVPDDIIREIEQSGKPRNRIPVRAPIDGIVTEMTACEGMYVTKASPMFTIADLSQVWVMVDVYEHRIDWLAVGQSARMTVPARPGRSWEGKVDYLYPELDPHTRTLQVRLVFANPGLVLKPNMFANVVINVGAQRDVLKIPAEALIVTGERETVVKLLADDGNGSRFQPVDVLTGMQYAGEVEILSGLDQGDQIVTSGQFLIDSESNLQASFTRLSGADVQSADAMPGKHMH